MTDAEFTKLKMRFSNAIEHSRKFEDAIHFLRKEQDKADDEMATLRDEVRAEKDAREDTL